MIKYQFYLKYRNGQLEDLLYIRFKRPKAKFCAASTGINLPEPQAFNKEKQKYYGYLADQINKEMNAAALIAEKAIEEVGIRATTQQARDVFAKIWIKPSDDGRRRKDDVISLFALIERFANKRRVEFSSGQIEATTFRNAMSKLSTLAGFLNHQYNEREIPITAIPQGFAEDYVNYLLSYEGKVVSKDYSKEPPMLREYEKGKIRPSVAIMHVSEIRNMFTYCRTNILKIECPLDSVRIKREKRQEREYLTKEEYSLIKSCRDAVPKKDRRYLDLFIFQCETGLAFQDAISVTEENIHSGMLKGRRIKTGMLYKVPISKTAEEIIERYRGKYKSLMPGGPKSNPTERPFGKPFILATYNYKIRAIAEGLGIEKEISSHTARHTFNQMLIEANVPDRVILSMMGQTSLPSNMRYSHEIRDDVVKGFSWD